MYVKIDPDPSKNATLLYYNNSIEAQIDQKDFWIWTSSGYLNISLILEMLDNRRNL